MADWHSASLQGSQFFMELEKMYAERMQVDVWDREVNRGIMFLQEHVRTGEVVIHSYQVGDKYFPAPLTKHASMEDAKSHLANHFPENVWRLRTMWEEKQARN